MSKSLWERTVETTIAVGERVLAPIERFIGRRSLVGDATFFGPEQFPWVAHIEDNWQVIREELQRVLEDRDALPNFQDISKDQIEITDDDRWKTYFLYGYGFEAELGVQTVPAHRGAHARNPRHEDGDVLDPLPAQAHPRPSGPIQGRAALPPRPDRARGRRVLPHPRWRRHPPLARGKEHDLRRHVQPRGVERHRRDARRAVRRRAAAASSPDAAINSAIVKAIGYSPFVLDAKRNQEAWEKRYRDRAAERASPGRAADLSAQIPETARPVRLQQRSHRC